MRTASEIHKKLLRGIFAVYKPPNMAHDQMIDNIKTKISSELNRLPLNEGQVQLAEKLKWLSSPSSNSVSEVSGNSLHPPTIQNTLDQLAVPVHRLESREISLHPNVLGDVWEKSDRALNGIGGLGFHSSGITVMGIGVDRRILRDIRLSLPIRVYRVQGELGKISNDFTNRSTVLSTYKYDKVTRASIDRICAGLQAFHQKDLYTKAGLDPSSDAAYRATCSGLIRPAGTSKYHSCVYSIKCVQFKAPYFTLEIHCVNETTLSLESLVDAVGAGLRCGAITTAIRRVRFGHFGLGHAIVEPQWTIDGIIAGISNGLEPYTRSIADLEQRVSSEIGVKSVASELVEREETEQREEAESREKAELREEAELRERVELIKEV